MGRKVTAQIDIDEVLSLKEHYYVEIPKNKHGHDVEGTYLIEGWLFIYPRNRKYGERYRQIYGFYQRGKLKEFVDLAMQNKFNNNDIFYGADNLKDEELIT